MINKKKSSVGVAGVSREGFWDVLRRPLVTEKSTRCGELGQYVFVVEPGVSKGLIKRAVEKVFSVDVVRVNVANVKGKAKNFRGRKGERKSFRKAFVRLAPGQDLSSVLGGLS